MESFREKKQENDHFGSTKLVSIDPSGEEIITLGEDDHFINCFIADSLNLSSAHNLKILDGKNVNSFYFLLQSSNFLIAAENQIYSFNWPICDVQNIIYEHDKEINLICATSSEDIIAISDQDNDIYLLKHVGQHQYKLIQKVFSSPDSKIVWIEFGPLCDTLAIYTQDSTITEINSKSYDAIFMEKTNSFCFPCFTNHSDLLFLKDGVIISKSQVHNNSAAFQNKNHNPEIQAIISSKSSHHIATYDSKGTIIVSKYDRSLFNYSAEPDLDSPQELPYVLKIEHPSSKLTTLFWRYDIIAAGDEEGALYFWEGVAGIPKPFHNNGENNLHESNKSKTISDPLKKKTFNLIDSLTAPVDPSRVRAKNNDDDEIISDNSETESKTSTKTSKKQLVKPKKQPRKQKQQQKLTAQKFLQEEKVSNDEDDESEMEDFIETREEFEERIKQNAPEPEPEPDIKFLESESSSDHEIDIEPYLTDEQRAKLQHHREEEEMLEKAANAAFDSDLNSDIGENIDNENIEDFDDEDLDELVEYDKIFMPGNCDYFVGNRRYMCWNDYGAILLRRDRDDESKTEIDIHTSADGKTRSIPNVNNYSLASIDENGLILANSNEVYYEHHKSWAPDKTTHVPFDKENVSLICSGDGWFAAATDAPCIRLFTSAGLQLGIIQLPLSCQVMIGRGKYLFYAYPSGTDLEFSILNVLKNKILVCNRQISAIRPIRWVGFSNNNKVFVQDRANIVYQLSKDFSWQWVPVLDLKEYFDTTTNNFWIVKVDEDVVYGVPLRSQRSPATYPIPRLHPIDTHIMTFDTEVRPWLSKRVLLDASKQKTDAELLKMFPSAVQSEHEFRAFHIAEQMKTSMARKFVVGYADKLNASVVADKLTGTDTKPTKKVFVIARGNSEESKKKIPVSRSSSSEQAVYVRKPRNSNKTIQPSKVNEKEEEKSDEDEENENIKDNSDDNDNEDEDEEKPAAVNSLFEALKKLGSKPTSLIVSRNDPIDLASKKKPKKKKSPPIVQRKRPRKAKKDDTATFQPLFQ